MDRNAHSPAPTARAGRSSRIACLLALAGLAGCAGPVSVRQVSLVHSYREGARTALQGGRPGDSTLIVLRRHALLALWRASPDRAIATLRTQASGHDDGADVLFALAELSYRQGLRHHRPQDFLAAAVYAYAYLQPGQAGGPDGYDPRFRQAGICTTWGWRRPSARRSRWRTSTWRCPLARSILWPIPRSCTGTAACWTISAPPPRWA
ncbi:hypothetical protein RAA17_14005 [Komagataeibacter rhaeticus]|nr:hypothetical protein [Komagataeibacter rhaeticus]